MCVPMYSAAGQRGHPKARVFTINSLFTGQKKGGGVKCSIGSTVTFDGSSDDLKSRRGDLKSSMRTRDLFWSHWGSMGRAWGSQGVKGSI